VNGSIKAFDYKANENVADGMGEFVKKYREFYKIKIRIHV